MPTPAWLVVALGNPLQGADGFGPAVLTRLRREGRLPDGVDLLDAHTDLLSHLDRLAQYDGVVLVDAALGVPAGQVSVIDEETFARWDDGSPGVHSVSPLVAVKLFRQIHANARTRIVLVALGIDRLQPGVGVSDEAIDAGAREVVRLSYTA